MKHMHNKFIPLALVLLCAAVSVMATTMYKGTPPKQQAPTETYKRNPNAVRRNNRKTYTETKVTREKTKVLVQSEPVRVPANRQATKQHVQEASKPCAHNHTWFRQCSTAYVNK